MAEPAMEGDPAMGEEKKKEDGFSKDLEGRGREAGEKKTEGNGVSTRQATGGREGSIHADRLQSTENLWLRRACSAIRRSPS